MVRIDYSGIKLELRSIIVTAGLSVNFETSIEGDILFDGFDNLVDIELASRDPSTSSVAMGTRTRYNILMVITVWSKNFEKSAAIIIRDGMISELEEILMQNRTLNGKVDTSWLLGGQNVSAFIEDNEAFVAAGEIRLNVESEIIV